MKKSTNAIIVTRGVYIVAYYWKLSGKFKQEKEFFLVNYFNQFTADHNEMN